jgi:hypothetical protein
LDLSRANRTAVGLLTITLPAVLIVTLALVLAVEAWVRITLDPRQSTPGLFVADPVRRIRLAPNYRGWFAGVPVQINSLGLRDDREYPMAKGPQTFRILVLGDSVTFGHGSVQEHTYPRLLERLLRAAHPQTDWQVWNAAVPGYNTSQELAQLLQLGPVARPDLVIVGFFENDLMENFEVGPPAGAGALVAHLRGFAQQHLYSLDLYRKAWLTMQWRLSASDAYRRRLEALDSEEQMFARPSDVVDRDLQQLTPYDRLSDEEVRGLRCPDGQRPDPSLADAIRNSPQWPQWVRAVRRLQALHAEGAYRIVFFLNVIPVICPDDDIFYDGGVGIGNALFLDVLRERTPAVSVFDAFLHRRPSQMPYAQAHAIGNANLTKAETLYEFLRQERLVPQ